MTAAFPKVTVGQELAFQDGSSMRSSWGSARYSFGWHVERVTPTGKGVAVRACGKNADGTPTLVRRGFQHQGYETTAGKDGHPNPNGTVCSYGGRFYQDVERLKAVVQRQERARAAADALNAVKLERPARDTWSQESMLEEVTRLEALLATARTAVEGI